MPPPLSPEVVMNEHQSSPLTRTRGLARALFLLFGGKGPYHSCTFRRGVLWKLTPAKESYTAGAKHRNSKTQPESISHTNPIRNNKVDTRQEATVKHTHTVCTQVLLKELECGPGTHLRIRKNLVKVMPQINRAQKDYSRNDLGIIVLQFGKKVRSSFHIV